MRPMLESLHEKRIRDAQNNPRWGLRFRRVILEVGIVNCEEGPIIGVVFERPDDPDQALDKFRAQGRTGSNDGDWLRKKRALISVSNFKTPFEL